jgi:hypothetical protein
MARLAGFEPTTPWFVAKYSIQLSYSRTQSEVFTASGGETKEPSVKKALEKMARLAGFEPTTPWFVAKYSIQLSYSRTQKKDYSKLLKKGKHYGAWACLDYRGGERERCDGASSRGSRLWPGRRCNVHPDQRGKTGDRGLCGPPYSNYRRGARRNRVETFLSVFPTGRSVFSDVLIAAAPIVYAGRLIE